MTFDEIKDLLETARKSKKNYDTVLRELEEIETLIENISVDYSKPRVQGSKENDLSKMIDKLSLTRKKCLEQLSIYIDNVTKAKELIDKVKNADGRDILSRRYLVGQSFEDIAENSSVVMRHVFRLHNDAIKEIVNLT